MQPAGDEGDAAAARQAAAMFALMDRDGNGVLDSSEFQSKCSDWGMDDASIDRLFVALDTNADGQISQEEFECGWSKVQEQTDGSPRAFHGLEGRPQDTAAANRAQRHALLAQGDDNAEYVWEYTSLAGRWNRIGVDATQQLIEEAFAAGLPSCEYEWRQEGMVRRDSLDLATMTQTHLQIKGESVSSVSGVQSAVRRRPLTRTPLAEQFDVCVGAHMVIPFASFRSNGCIPRSSDALAIGRDPLRKLVFVSHRWLRPWMSKEECEAHGAAWAGTPHPDDAENSKHALITEGLSQIAAREGWREEEIDVWIDFACVEQDDQDEKRKGIESLLAFVTRADAVLIPSMHGAPMYNQKLQLDVDCVEEYGSRAWCMLECFAFWCASMVRRIAEPRLYCAWRNSADPVGMEKVKYDLLALPSSGSLTNELDKPFIEQHEMGVRDQYGEAAVVARCVQGAETIDLGDQLLDTRHITTLLDHLGRCTAAEGGAESLVAVDLRGNHIGDDFAEGLAELLCQQGMPRLRSLKLYRCNISDRGALALARALTVRTDEVAPRLEFIGLVNSGLAVFERDETREALRDAWKARSPVLHVSGLEQYFPDCACVIPTCQCQAARLRAKKRDEEYKVGMAKAASLTGSIRQRRGLNPLSVIVTPAEDDDSAQDDEPQLEWCVRDALAKNLDGLVGRIHRQRVSGTEADAFARLRWPDGTFADTKLDSLSRPSEDEARAFEEEWKDSPWVWCRKGVLASFGGRIGCIDADVHRDGAVNLRWGADGSRSERVSIAELSAVSEPEVHAFEERLVQLRAEELEKARDICAETGFPGRFRLSGTDDDPTYGYLKMDGLFEIDGSEPTVNGSPHWSKTNPDGETRHVYWAHSKLAECPSGLCVNLHNLLSTAGSGYVAQYRVAGFPLGTHSWRLPGSVASGKEWSLTIEAATDPKQSAF